MGGEGSKKKEEGEEWEENEEKKLGRRERESMVGGMGKGEFRKK